MKLLLPIILVVILVGGYFVFKQTSKTPYNVPQISSPSPRQDLKTFESKMMNFSIKFPSRYEVEEKFTTVDVVSPEGRILISRNSTNFTNLDNYLDDLSKKNKTPITEKESLTINGLSSIKGVIDGGKTYFLYTSNRIYSISTKTESLYPTLDQIAQSFHYAP